MRHSRRISIAVLVAAFVWASGALVLGTSAAGKPALEPTIPQDFGVPARLLGDTGLFKIQGEDGSETSLRFAVSADNHLPDASGAWHRITQFDLSVDGQAATHVYADHARGTVVADGGHEARLSPLACTAIGNCGRETLTFHVQTFRDADGPTPCGLANSFQGRTIPSVVSDLVWSCEWATGPGRWTDFRAIATFVDGSRSYTGFESNAEHGRLEIWFDSAIAYPVEIAHQRPGEDRATVMTLETFRPGSLSLPLIDVPLPKAKAKTTTGTAWGPDDANVVGHFFPLSQAYDHAVNNGPLHGVEAFLAQHPDAYVYYASFSDLDQTNVAIWSGTWRIGFTDGQNRVGVAVTKQIPARLLTTLTGFGPAQGYNESKDPSRLETAAWAPPPGTRPNPALRPQEFVTAESLRGLWASVKTVRNQPIFNIDGWGFEVLCATNECTEAETRYWAGYNTISNGFDRNPDGRPVHNEYRVISVLEVSPGGTPLRLSESVQKRGVSSPEVPLLEEPETEPVVLSRVVGKPPLDVSKLILPASILAAATGILAYVWMSLRAGVAFLFSRVEEQALLRHPLRAQIVQALEEEPGLRFIALRRRLGTAHGTLMHHLRRLLTSRHVVARVVDSQTCYFAGGRTSPEEQIPAVVQRNEGTLRCLSQIHAEPGLSIAELARRLGVKRQTAFEKVNSLERAGFVAVERMGRKRCLHLTPLGERVPART